MDMKRVYVYMLRKKEEHEYEAFYNDKQYIYDKDFVAIGEIRLTSGEIQRIAEDDALQEKIKHILRDKFGNGTYDLRPNFGGVGGSPYDKTRKKRYKQDKKHGFAKPCGFKSIITLKV